jgi:hypothetical protein
MGQILTKLSYCFYFPYHEDSGVPVLFFRLANVLALKYPEIQVYVIDYENGAMARHLIKAPNITLCIFEDGKDMVPPEDAVLVMQSDVPYYWPKELKPGAHTKLFFWNLHPRNFIPSLLPFPFIRELPYNSFALYKLLVKFYPGTMARIINYVKLLLDNNALYFMDQTNSDYTNKFLFLNYKTPNYLPVPITSPQTEQAISSKKINKKELNFAWLGRICDFKIHILIYTCNKVAVIAEQLQVKIKFYIIGDGPFMDYAKQHIIETSFLSVVYCGAIPHSKLADFFLNKVDVVASMGTAALESAVLKIPTILLDFSYKKIDINYKFRWLYDTVNFDLGHEISAQDHDATDESLKSMLIEFIDNYEFISNRTFEYCNNNHMIENIVDRFIDFSSHTKLKFNMLDNHYFKKPLLLKLYNKMRSLKS